MGRDCLTSQAAGKSLRMVTYSSVLPTNPIDRGEAGGLQSMGSWARFSTCTLPLQPAPWFLEWDFKWAWARHCCTCQFFSAGWPSCPVFGSVLWHQWSRGRFLCSQALCVGWFYCSSEKTCFSGRISSSHRTPTCLIFGHSCIETLLDQ